MAMQSVRPQTIGRPEQPAADISRSALRKVMLAAYSGSAVEYYDFFVYGIAAALVFPSVFFSNLSPTLATVASLGTFATAFLARPVGGVVFGHIGDRWGRKRALMLTMFVMGVSTVGVGLLPGMATIGVAAPVLLIALRLLQGFAVGGEWTGAALLCTESAPPHLRGRCSRSIQYGIGTALVAVNLIFLLSHGVLGETESAFFEWGWRIPFLLSAVLIAIGIYVRRNVAEPGEAAASASGATRLPIAEVLRRQPLQLLLGAGMVAGGGMLVYQASTFLATYAETGLGYPKSLILIVGALGGVCLMISVAAAGALCDRYGGRRLMTAGYAAAVPWSLAMLPLIRGGGPMAFAATVLSTYLLIGVIAAPMAVVLPRIFAARYRYSGAATAHNLGMILGGAVPPVISPLLMNGGGTGVGLMMAGFAMLSLLCAAALQTPGVNAYSVDHFPAGRFGAQERIIDSL